MYRKISVLLVFAFLVIAIFSFSQSALAATEEPQVVRELNERRESNSKTFLLSNGNYKWIGYTEDVHYLDRNGIYQEISNKIVPEIIKTEGSDYAYRNEANKFIVRFAENTTEKYLVNIDYKGNSISFGPANGKAASAVIGNIGNETLSDITCTDNCVTFKNVYSDTDLVYKTETYGIKEYIVLNKFTEKNEYVFDLKMDGVSAKQIRESIIFTDVNGNNIFNTGTVYAVDSEGVQTKTVTCNLIENNGRKQIMVTIDKAYLADANRSFPIIIDPSVMITGETVTFDSFVSSRYPDNKYYLYDWLRTGRDTDYYTRRSFIKFTLPTNIPAGYVTSAYLKIKKYSGADPVMHAYMVTEDWTSSTVTWNNQPDIDDEYESTLAEPIGSWWRMYVTTPVTQWLSGYPYNYGFMLRDATESGTTQWTTFYSSDSDYPNKPELHIEFTGYGCRPYEYEDSGDINCGGYALDYPYWLNFRITEEGLNSCANESALFTYTQNQIDDYIDDAEIGHNTLSTYLSYISTGKWRVVWRMGYEDDGDGIVDIDNDENDMYDFHWWYQTDTGQWAEKMSWLPSNLVSGTDANTNPDDINWPNFGYSDFYDSTCKYYAIYE